MIQDNMSYEHFSVTFPKSISRFFFVLCIIILLIPIAFTLFQGERNPAMYVCFLLFGIPFLLSGIWMRNYRIDVEGSHVSVSRGIGIWYSFEVSDIAKIICKVKNTRMGTSTAIQIFAQHHKIAVSNLMKGSERLSEYIQERVPVELIRVVDK